MLQYFIKVTHVVCVSGVKSKNDNIYANDVIFGNNCILTAVTIVSHGPSLYVLVHTRNLK